MQLVRDKIRIVENVAGAAIQFEIGNYFNDDGEVAGVKTVFVMPLFKGTQFELWHG